MSPRAEFLRKPWLYRDPSLWEQHPRLILATVAVVGLQLLLIVGLIVQRDGRRAGEVILGIEGMVRKADAARKLVDLNDLIAQTLRLTQSDALAHDCAVLTEFHSALPKVEVDLVQLQQVFIILILNAFEASEDVPKLQRRIIIRTERDSDGAVRACVRDFGAGLPAEAPGRIFEQFFSTKREGTGMGLFISRSI